MPAASLFSLVSLVSLVSPFSPASLFSLSAAPVTPFIQPDTTFRAKATDRSSISGAS